jgi:hypothetical protein
MRIEFLAPLRRSYERMKIALFHPFDLGKWLVVGFAAWLAWLGQNGGGGGGSNWGARQDLDGFRAEARRGIDRVSEFLSEPFWLALAVFAALLVIVIVVAVIWVSSRGKFVFLHNVVHDGREIVEPWKKTAILGNSLFLWRLGFVVVIVLTAVPFVLGLWFTIAAPFLSGDLPRMLPGAGLVLAWVCIGVVFAFVSHYLENFVVPIMYRHDLKAVPAWGRFLSLFGSDPVSFLLFAFLTLALWIVIGLAIVLLGCFTCCCAWLLLAIPYIGTVLFLPVLYTYRAWGPEFLAQFGPEWTLWPAPPPPVDDGPVI